LVEQPIRNRQVSGSSPLVGSILSSICDQFTATCCNPAARAILVSSCFMAAPHFIVQDATAGIYVEGSVSPSFPTCLASSSKLKE
jgi:hypothetical protein